VNKYYLTPTSILKVQTITISSNGTKFSTYHSENKLYENSTSDNFIILHRSMWRGGDFVKFPRFLFGPNEKVSQVTVKMGFAYLRMFNLTASNHEHYAVSNS
jgi:hypothetical protein